jgi:hypothetical protein
MTTQIIISAASTQSVNSGSLILSVPPPNGKVVP